MPRPKTPSQLKSSIKLNISVTDSDVKRLAQILNLPENLDNNKSLEELFSDTRDAVLSYYDAKLNEQLKPRGVVRALGNIIKRMQDLHDALPGTAPLRQRLTGIIDDLGKSQLEYEAVFEDRKRNKATNRKQAPLKTAVGWLRIVFCKHNSAIQKKHRDKAWSEYVDFALTLGKIWHPDPATNRTRWLKLINATAPPPD